MPPGVNGRAMRILFYAKHVDRDGIGYHTLALARWLRGRGHEVAVVADGGELAPALAEAGVRLYRAPYRRRLAFGAAREATLAAVREFRPDAGHCQWRICSPHAEAARKRYGVPFLHVLHSTRTRVAAPLTYWGGVAVAVSAETERELLERWRLPPGRVRRIPDGVDTGRLRPPTAEEREAARRSLGLPAGAWVVLWAGRMVPVKRVDDLIAAVGRLQPAEGRSPLLLLAGDGPLRRALEAEAARRAPGRVRFLGWLDDLRPAFWAADLFALPSAREGFAQAAAEAMACGLPLVRTAGGGAEEQAGAALEVPPGDVGALTAALERLRRDEEERARRAEAARRLAEGRYSLEAMGEAYERLYRELRQAALPAAVRFPGRSPERAPATAWGQGLAGAPGAPGGTALVTDARYRTALAMVRSLGRSGVRVLAAESGRAGEGGPEPEPLAFASRYVAGRFRLPDARREPEAFVEAVVRLAGEQGVDALLPAGAASLAALSRARERVAAAVGLLVPPAEKLELANDKARLLELAARAGVPVPRAWQPEAGEPLDRFAARVEYPCVVKFRFGEGLGLPAARRYRICRGPGELVAAWRSMDALQRGPLVEEYLPGPGFGLSALYDQEARPVALFAHRRLREYPLSGGPSALAESCWEPELARLGLRLLDALEWQGVAMVEFRLDARGRYRLLEVNPRPWGSLPLAVAAAGPGAAIPTLWYRLARGERLDPIPRAVLGAPLPPVSPSLGLASGYRVGVRLRFAAQDALASAGLLRRLRRRGDGAALLAELARDWLDPRVRDGVFDAGDPRPGWVYLRRSLARLARRSGGAEEEQP
ncbi:MAG: glycosyltransferase [Bacillota bacterium]|nr:glycosyltransferase [Bacillota bacterium]